MKFLLVRLGALGDIVHAIPVAVALRRAYPDARIDWLVSAKHRAILDLVPGRSPPDRRERSRQRRRRAVASSPPIGELRRTRYDVAIDMQGLLKSAVVARLSGARRVIGFNAAVRARVAGALLLHRGARSGRRRDLRRRRRTRHVVTINLGLLDAARAFRRPRPSSDIDAPRSAAVIDVIARAGGRLRCSTRARRGRTSGGRRAAWRNSRVDCGARRDLRSIVLWGPGERELADAGRRTNAGDAAIAGAAHDASPMSRRWPRAAAVMVSGDTGPTHIASAVGTPLVGIYGPTRPERNGPLGADDDGGVARIGVSVPSSATMPARPHVPARHRRGRSAGRRRTAPRRGGASPWLTSPRRLARLRVPLGFVFAVAGAVACAAVGHRRCWREASSRWLGEVLRIWAAGHLNKSREVTSSGPYRWFAHPLYVGSSIMGVGLAIASRQPAIVAAFIAAVPRCDDHRRDQERRGVSPAEVRRSVRSLSTRRGRRARRRGADQALHARAGDRESRASRASAEWCSRCCCSRLKAAYNGTFWRAAGPR